MGRRIFYRPERCMSCLSCVLACQLHSLGVSDARKIRRGEKPTKRISMDMIHGTPWALKCQHCVSAPCVEACITGSLVQHEGHAEVIHHPETCVGCGSCLLACPFSALAYDDRDEKMDKCNLCPEDEVPACVRACQSKALIYRPPSAFASEKKKAFAKELRRVRETT